MGSLISAPIGPLGRTPKGGIELIGGDHLVLFEDGTMGVRQEGEQYDGSEYGMLYHSPHHVSTIERSKEVDHHDATFFRFSLILFAIYAVMYLLVRFNSAWPSFIPEWEYFWQTWFLVPVSIHFFAFRFLIRSAGELKVFPTNSDPHVLPVTSGALSTASNLLALSIATALGALVSLDGAEWMCDAALIALGICVALPHIWPGLNRPLFVSKGHLLIPQLDLDAFHEQSTNILQEMRQRESSESPELLDLLMSNESQSLEFKASLWTTYIGTTDQRVKEQNAKNFRLQDSVVKTVAGFMNTDGGTLLIGVLDKPRTAGNEVAKVVGIEPDYDWLGKRADVEGFTHSMIQLLNDAFGSSAITKLHVVITTPPHDGKRLCRLDVTPRQRERNNEVWVKTKTMGDEEFFFRASDTTTHASAKSAHNYIRHHFEGFSGDHNKS